MAQTIKLRRSATASAVPTTGQLALGELAINTWDGKLFLKKDNGTQSIVEIGAGGGGASVTISTTAPSSPAAGDLWWDSTNGKLKIYYTDANTSQWVDASVGVKGDTGAAGATGASGTIDGTTLSTLTGVLKANGTNVTTATAGTDYLAPPSGTALLKADSGGALANAVSGTDYQAPIGTISGIAKGNGANALTAAVAGTDYLAPPSGTALLKADSGGALANAVANTDYLPATNPVTTGNMGIGIANDGTQILHIAAGSASKAPLEFNAGALMTSPDAGSMEYDGAAFYLSPFGSGRGVVPAEQCVILGTAYTLTSQTAAQKLFNATTNGAVNVEADTYWFECGFSLTAMSGTTQSFGFALAAGTAVIGSQGWRSMAAKAALATGSTLSGTFSTAANTNLTPNSTSTTGHAFICGIVRITTAGTIIPSVSLGVAAAAVVGANSFFRIYPLSAINAAATNITIGNWS